MTPVDRLQKIVDKAFDESDRQLTQAIRHIVAEHSEIGAIASGKTVRRISKAAELLAEAALLPGRAQAAQSPVLRSKLQLMEGRRLDGIVQAAEGYFARLGIAGPEATDLLVQSITRARQKKSSARPPATSSFKTRLITAATFIGRHMASFLFGLVGALVAAFIIFKLGWN